MGRLTPEREAEIRAESKRLRATGQRFGRGSYPTDVDALLHELKHVRRDAANERGEYHDLITRQGALLTGVANGLRGEPPELVWWDHSDLPTRAAAMKADLEKAEQYIEEHRSIG